MSEKKPDQGDEKPEQGIEAQAEPTPPARAGKPKRSWRSWALEAAIIALVFFGVRTYQQRNVVSGPAPTLQGAGLEGEPLDLATLREEGPVMVFFWATWCGVCDSMDEAVSAVAEDHRVITVASSSGSAVEIRAHMADEGIDFPLISDPEGVLAHAWGVSAFPTVFIVDSDGEIRATEVGFTTGLGMRARLFFAE